jgi:hypothetical protein
MARHILAVVQHTYGNNQLHLPAEKLAVRAA